MKKNHTNNVIKITYTLYKKINNAIVKNESHFSYVFLFVKRRILFRIKDLYLPVILLKGKEKYSNKDITVVYCGDDYSFHYISEMLFEEKCEAQYIGRYFLWNLSKILYTTSKQTDITIIKTDRFFSRYLQKKGFIIIPAWINMKLDISKPFEDIIKNFKKSAIEDVRKIKKFNYSYELTKNQEEFNRFFNEIRDPYFLKRIGKQAIPGTTNYFELNDAFKRGTLFLVKDREQVISGFIVIHNDHKASPHFMGIKEEKELYEVAASALFYFFIKWAKEKGITILNFGLTRSFLNDGPFRFKRKWGMTAEIDNRPFGMFAIKINNFCTEAIEGFFENNPFLYLKNNTLVGLVFSSSPLSSDDQKKLLKKYYIDGITTLNIIQTNEQLASFLTNFNS